MPTFRRTACLHTTPTRCQIQSGPNMPCKDKRFRTINRLLSRQSDIYIPFLTFTECRPDLIVSDTAWKPFVWIHINKGERKQAATGTASSPTSWHIQGKKTKNIPQNEGHSLLRTPAITRIRKSTAAESVHPTAHIRIRIRTLFSFSENFHQDKII